ncbi:hypothetical protein H7J88_28085 [Mycolicibacterium flavescens]|uniref:hypothetical protein n=1 Tax=Mycolicibacterium flavescens TaxID=1776 RepID=UPI0010421A0B|nr:hypothetical protein [Mycolicibacterium flavescens]MCV7283504.1 hypothetical protein [Mycolicibacterium flavescens]
MSSLVPPTVRQARWLIVGGIFAIVLGGLRGHTFFTHGGLVYLMLSVVFVGIGVASILASIQRIRLGDAPRDATRG